MFRGLTLSPFSPFCPSSPGTPKPGLPCGCRSKKQYQCLHVFLLELFPLIFGNLKEMLRSSKIVLNHFSFVSSVTLYPLGTCDAYWTNISLTDRTYKQTCTQTGNVNQQGHRHRNKRQFQKQNPSR